MALYFPKHRVSHIGRYLLGTSLVMALTAIEAPAQAITFVTDRTDLNESDRVDWSAVGDIFNPVGPPDPSIFLPGTFEVFSEAGFGVEVTIPEATTPGLTPPFVFQTGPAPSIGTNFDNGDFILFTGLIIDALPPVGNPGPLTLTFETPILGAGAQLAAGATPSFTGTISAFDERDRLLGTFAAPGTSSEALDNTAPFFGVLSDRPTIAKLEFATSEAERPFGINQLSLVTTAASVPEPAVSFALLPMLGLGLWGRHSQKGRHHA